MKFSGSFDFNTEINEVWKNLNDPYILKKSIHGCVEFKEKEKNKFFIIIQVKIGPINAKFSGDLEIKEIDPLNSYIIEAKGNAGQLGGASGEVRIKLDKNGSRTILNYEANTKIYGKIAQLGSRLIEGTVKKNTSLFFTNFEKLCFEKTHISDNLTNQTDLNKNNEVFRKNKLIYICVGTVIVLIMIIFYILYE